ATIITESKEDVLLVPNTALRFTPPAELMPEAEDRVAAPRGERQGNRTGERSGERGGMLAQLMPGPRRFMGPRNRNQREGAPQSQHSGPRRVWVLVNG